MTSHGMSSSMTEKELTFLWVWGEQIGYARMGSYIAEGLTRERLQGLGRRR